MRNFLSKAACLATLLFLILSCFSDTMGRRFPKPSANPYILSYEEKETNIKVKYLRDMEPHNSQWDDKINQSGFPYLKKQIENEWITVYFENTGDNETRWLQVTVKENLSNDDRSYHLKLKYKPQTTLFTITQRGRK